MLLTRRICSENFFSHNADTTATIGSAMSLKAILGRGWKRCSANHVWIKKWPQAIVWLAAVPLPFALATPPPPPISFEGFSGPKYKKLRDFPH